MEKDTTSHRLSSLDGLRGFAIILVFLNHLQLSFLAQYVPSWIIAPFISDGVTGVTFLFILSGFLMNYIYPAPTSWVAFLQKRYTRIFPLFLTMCCVMFVYYLQPRLSGVYIISLMGILAGVVHVIWVYKLKKLSSGMRTKLFLLFLSIQGLTGMYYAFFVMRHPEQFNQLMPESIKNTLVLFVNGTLTLPFGNYVPLLDGVYWSLVAEVVFYLLYPIIFSLLMHFFLGCTKKVQVWGFISLLLLVGGIHILSQKIAVLSMIQPALWVYFLVGMLLAHMYKHHNERVNTLAKLFLGKAYLLPVILFLLVLISQKLLGSIASDAVDPWIRILYAIPIALLVLLMLDSRMVLSKLFSNRLLVILGTISYSVYLCHAIIIHLVDRILVPTTVLTTLVYILVTSVSTLCISSVLYYLLERPYFLQKKQTVVSQNPSIITKLSPRFLLLGLSLLYIGLICWVYQSQYNFFSQTYPIAKQSIDNIVVLDRHTKFSTMFTGRTNDLGIIAARFIHTKQEIPTDQRLKFSLREKATDAELATGSYTLDYFNDQEVFPFGFPIIHDTKNKEFIVEFSIENPTIRDTVSLDTTSLLAVHMVTKSEMTNPVIASKFLYAKIVTVVQNPEAQLVFVIGSPAILLTAYLLFTTKDIFKKRKSHSN